MPRLDSRWLPSGLVFVALLVVGCSGDSAPAGVVVNGKLLHNGLPLKDPGNPGTLVIELYPATAGAATEEIPAESFGATYNYTNGAFTVPGPGGNGIQPGKYKVVVRYWEIYDEESPDKFNNAFTLENTKIVRDFGGAEVVIDLAKPEG
ncbi:MAG: hypothetical protein HYS13_07950 [Planctomycetia bacterium]|nr:hypothetical protein [Planctomycetia bacterium]